MSPQSSQRNLKDELAQNYVNSLAFMSRIRKVEVIDDTYNIISLLEVVSLWQSESLVFQREVKMEGMGYILGILAIVGPIVGFIITIIFIIMWIVLCRNVGAIRVILLEILEKIKIKQK